MKRWKDLPLDEQPRLRANRENAAASTGPRTKVGKAHSAKNALQHGLNVPVANDPALAPHAEAIARKIVGTSLNLDLLKWARQIAAAQVDLNRIRSLRRDAIAQLLADPLGGQSIGVGKVRLLERFLTRVEHDNVRETDIEMMNGVLRPQLKEDAKLALILADKSGKLTRLDRYERRALSRRKNAIRSYDAVHSVVEGLAIYRKDKQNAEP